MRKGKLSLAVGAFVALAGGSGMSQASPGYAAGYATGMNVACNMCAGAAESAFATIRGALMLSEQAIGRAINDGPYYTPVPIGFPALQTQINVSSASATESIVTAITNSTQGLIEIIGQQPAIRKAIEEDIKRPDLPELEMHLDSRGGCQSLQYGRVMELNPRSSLGWGYQYVTQGRFEDRSGEGVGNSIEPPASLPTDSEGLTVAITDINTRARQSTNREFEGLRERAEATGAAEPRIADVLDPSILYNADHRTLGLEPDDFGLSDDERADYLIQYLMVDAPTHADALAASAATPAALNAAVDGQIHNMEFSMAMASLDDIIELRRARSGTTGPDAFLAEAMGEEAPEASSQDDFWYRISHYRQQDLQWTGRVLIDSNYATAQQVQMESEHLALKYERWKTMRTNTLLLAQAVANVMEKERDGND